MLLKGPDNKLVLVDSAVGYEAWEVIAQGVSRPGEFQKWGGSGWVDDSDARKAHEMLQIMRDPNALATYIKQAAGG